MKQRSREERRGEEEQAHLPYMAAHLPYMALQGVDKAQSLSALATQLDAALQSAPDVRCLLPLHPTLATMHRYVV